MQDSAGNVAVSVPPSPACVVARVTWTPPTMMTDNTPIPPGLWVCYTIYVGESSRRYGPPLTVPGPSANLAVFSDLNTNVTYHFAARSLGSDGSMSEFFREATLNKTDCGARTLALDKNPTSTAIWVSGEADDQAPGSGHVRY